MICLDVVGVIWFGVKLLVFKGVNGERVLGVELSGNCLF